MWLHYFDTTATRQGSTQAFRRARVLSYFSPFRAGFLFHVLLLCLFYSINGYLDIYVCVCVYGLGYGYGCQPKLFLVPDGVWRGLGGTRFGPPGYGKYHRAGLGSLWWCTCINGVLFFFLWSCMSACGAGHRSFANFLWDYILWDYIFSLSIQLHLLMWLDSLYEQCLIICTIFFSLAPFVMCRLFFWCLLWLDLQAWLLHCLLMWCCLAPTQWLLQIQLYALLARSTINPHAFTILFALVPFVTTRYLSCYSPPTLGI